jgi:hypothetical protein
MQFHIETYRDHHLVVKAKGDDVWTACIIEKRAITRTFSTASEAIAEARAMVDDYLSADSAFGGVPSTISQPDRHATRDH